MKQLRPATEIDAEHTGMLDAVKQLSIYTDCFGDSARWSAPGDAVDLEFAPAILATARMLNSERQTTVRELDLWVEYVRPHYNKPTMPDAMLAFQRQLFNEGLTSTTPEALESFMRGSPVPVDDACQADSG